MNRKKRVAFERVARQYRNYQRELMLLREHEEAEQEWEQMAEQVLEANIRMTEEKLALIGQKHGADAERMVNDWLIERKTQSEIASESGFSERHVRRLLEAYLDDALSENE